MKLASIAAVQGPGLFSPLADSGVRTRGVVTGNTRKGFFLQDPDTEHDPDCSHGLFVFTRRDHPATGALVEVEGKVFDFVATENDRPTTQLVAKRTKLLRKKGPQIQPVWLDAALLSCDPAELALRLNRLEGMLVGIEAGSELVAGSNPFGDYVALPPRMDLARTPHGGVLIDPGQPQRWLPGFRITDYANAPRLNVGARLIRAVIGPLNYRSSAYQVAVPRDTGFRLEFEEREVELPPSRTATEHELSILTLNGFNLDPHVERPAFVHDPKRDIDDDVGDGRYRALAHDVVHRAGSPDLIALQEIQDDDGAEITETVDAARNYGELIQAIEREKGPTYRWADVPPVANADGGQPGGNIRNGFLFDPARVELIEGTLARIGEDDPPFDDSRKPLVAHFRHVGSGLRLAVINVHLASKRHQHPIFAPERPGFDPRESQRIEQARLIREQLLELQRAGHVWYVTGDFNDYEFSETLRTVTGEESVNLVDLLPADERYDYNHRGTSEALLHAVVPRELAGEGRATYQILHGNELLGVTPGTQGERATDHAYGLARLTLSADEG